MQQQRNVFHMREQDENLGEQKKKIGDRQSTCKRIQRNNSKDNPRSRKKNESKDREDIRNV